MKIDNIPIDLILKNMFAATGTVLKIFFLTILFSVPLGFLVALARRSRFKIISLPTRIYQLIFRGTPLMLQLFFFMYGPFYIFGKGFERFTACIAFWLVMLSRFETPIASASRVIIGMD